MTSSQGADDDEQSADDDERSADDDEQGADDDFPRPTAGLRCGGLFGYYADVVVGDL